jgi:superoxide dismutase, Cu-Zn family
MKGTLMSLAIAGAASLALAGLGPESKAAGGAKASAVIESKSGSQAHGSAHFEELSTGGVKVHVHMEQATPGKHGLHIHEKGDCSDPEGKNAGGHFNPGSMEHAGPMDAKRHAGDLGNIEIKADGSGDLDITTDMLTVKPGPNSVVGKAVVFHEKEDDLKTQPTGNAGGRYGCGAIK